MWICQVCSSNNVSRSPYCAYCKGRHGIITLRPASQGYEYDFFDEDVFKVRVALIDYSLACTSWRVTMWICDKCKSLNTDTNKACIKCIGSNNSVSTKESMTPQEELYSEYFFGEKKLIKDMPDLELRAHREEMAKIAFEARARVDAINDEERERRKANKTKAGGFRASVQTDEVTSDAINKIKARQGKLSKEEKIMQGLIRMGMSEKDAQATMSAGAILKQIRDRGSKALNEKTDSELKPASSDNGAPKKPLFNPFAPKVVEPVETQPEITIVEETNTVIITRTEPSIEQPTEPAKPKLFNPFEKRG